MFSNLLFELIYCTKLLNDIQMNYDLITRPIHPMG